MNARQNTLAGLFATLLFAGQLQAQEPAAAPASPPPVANDPTARDLLTTNPTDPVDILQTIDLLIDLKEPQAGTGLMRKLIDAQLDEEKLVALHSKFGSGFFLKLGRTKELSPDANKFASAVMEAAVKRARDPARLTELVDQLKSPTPAVREAAAEQLRLAHEAAVPALLAVLVDPARAEEHSRVRAVLVMLGDDAVGPVTALLETGDVSLESSAVEILGRINEPNAELFMLGPAFGKHSPAELRDAARRALSLTHDGLPASPAAAAARLFVRAQAYYEGQQQLETDVTGNVPSWHWDKDMNQPVLESLPPRMASFRLAMKLAHEAAEILPDNAEIRRLYLAASIEHDLASAKPGESLAEGAAATALVELSMDELQALMANSSTRHPAVAAVAAREIGNRGTPELLFASGARPATLVQMARHPDRRLRFAAVEAILKLKPDSSFPGSSYVSEAIEFFIRSHGVPRVLVADPRADVAQRLAAILAEVGYEADVAVDPYDVLQMATTNADYDFALIDARLAAPNSAELLSRLRQDCRTAALPIEVIAVGDDLPPAEALARRITSASAALSPASKAEMEAVKKQLLTLAGRGYVPPAERLQESKQALAWLDWLTTYHPKLYRFHTVEPALITALLNPALSTSAASILSRLNTPASQRALMDLASQPLAPIERRQTAALAFGASVERFGTLLSTSEIAQQYERYNASEAEGPESQQVLGYILDVIEARPKLVTKTRSESP